MIPVYLSAGFLILLALVGVASYARAVARGYRAYVHVVFAFAYVAVLTVVSTIAVSDEGQALHAIVVLANLIGGGAMLNLINRFRKPERG